MATATTTTRVSTIYSNKTHALEATWRYNKVGGAASHCDEWSKAAQYATGLLRFGGPGRRRPRDTNLLHCTPRRSCYRALPHELFQSTVSPRNTIVGGRATLCGMACGGSRCGSSRRSTGGRTLLHCRLLRVSGAHGSDAIARTSASRVRTTASAQPVTIRAGSPVDVSSLQLLGKRVTHRTHGM